jgi:integrase
LDYAIEKCGAPGRWKPLEGEDRDALIGTADDGDDKLTPPIKPEQLEALLDALVADEKPELWLAVALVGCFGLRPAELAALSVEDGRLKVASNVKRNRRSMKNQKPPRLAIALDLADRDDGARALRQLESGLVKLPRAICTAIDSGEFKKVGDAFRQLLDRYPFWQSLVSSTPDLTPYSLRHGWAWRAHKGYATPLSVRDAAALMGHTPSTHHRHYGRWTDEAGLLEAVEKITRTAAAPIAVRAG